jgi:hypothetical protein
MSRAAVAESLRAGEPAGTAFFAAILQRSRTLRHGIRAAVGLKPCPDFARRFRCAGSNHSIAIKNS